MPQFRTAPVSEVAPKRRVKGASKRAETHAMYVEALSPLVTNPTEAIVVGLDADDKVLTIRNRIKRAITELGLTVTVRRSGNEIRVYRTDALDGGDVAAPESVTADSDDFAAAIEDAMDSETITAESTPLAETDENETESAVQPYSKNAQTSKPGKRNRSKNTTEVPVEL